MAGTDACGAWEVSGRWQHDDCRPGYRWRGLIEAKLATGCGRRQWVPMKLLGAGIATHGREEVARCSKWPAEMALRRAADYCLRRRQVAEGKQFMATTIDRRKKRAATMTMLPSWATSEIGGEASPCGN